MLDSSSNIIERLGDGWNEVRVPPVIAQVLQPVMEEYGELRYFCQRGSRSAGHTIKIEGLGKRVEEWPPIAQDEHVHIYAYTGSVVPHIRFSNELTDALTKVFGHSVDTELVLMCVFQSLVEQQYVNC